MKSSIITTTIFLVSIAAFAAEPPPPPPGNSSTASTPVLSAGGGKATITIDVNGKKETREIEVGDGFEIKAGTRPKLDLPASAITDVKTVVRTTWLGVAAEEVSDELRAQLPLDPGAGLIVRSVIPESPAAAASLQKNDVLMKLDDQLLTNPPQLRTLVSSRKEGDTVKLTYFRRGQQAVVDVKLATHEEREMGYEFPVLSAIPRLGRLFQTQTRAVVVDKDGKVIGGEDQADLNATVDKIEKSLRDAGLDEKIIAETKHTLAETANAIRDALNEAGAAKQEIQKGAAEVVKALEQARAAMDKARKLSAEDAAKKGESRETRAGAIGEEFLRRDAAKP